MVKQTVGAFPSLDAKGRLYGAGVILVWMTPVFRAVL
jgi:hypothetical protein